MEFIEVDLFEQASHVQVVGQPHAALKLIENKIYDLFYGDMRDGWTFSEYHIINEIGQRLHGFPFFKCKLLREV